MSKAGAGALDGVAADLEILPGHASPSPTIRTPHPHDVLLGRGTRINSHPGNFRFRALVNAHKPMYLHPHTRKPTKALLTAQIVAYIRGLDPPGRFLRQEHASSGTWVETGEEHARKKAGQLLKESTPELRWGIGLRPAGESQRRAALNAMRNWEMGAGARHMAAPRREATDSHDDGPAASNDRNSIKKQGTPTQGAQTSQKRRKRE